MRLSDTFPIIVHSPDNFLPSGPRPPSSRPAEFNSPSLSRPHIGCTDSCKWIGSSLRRVSLASAYPVAKTIMSVSSVEPSSKSRPTGVYLAILLSLFDPISPSIIFWEAPKSMQNPPALDQTSPSAPASSPELSLNPTLRRPCQVRQCHLSCVDA